MTADTFKKLGDTAVVRRFASMTSRVLPYVTSEWRSARQIHRAMDCWAMTTVKTALHELAQDGRIERRDAVNRYQAPINEYRLAQR